jgi:hypothetical protein
MRDSVWSEFSRWIRLIAEAVCDFVFLSLWGFMVLALHHLVKDIWLLEGWSRYVEYAMEALIDVSILTKLLRLRFDFLKPRDKGHWWK